MFVELLTLQGIKPPIATVSIYFTSDCPVSLDAAPNLLRAVEATDFRWELFSIDATAQPKGQEFLKANPSIDFKWDKTGQSAREAGFDRVPAVTVSSPDGKLLYRGAMASKRDANGRIQFYLGDVLTRLRSGQPINVRDRPVEGCQLPQDVSTDIPPMRASTPLGEAIRQSCLPCHRTGGHAPFPLETSAQVRAWTPMIREVLRSGKMPPRTRWSETEEAGFVMAKQPHAEPSNLELLLNDPVDFQPLAYLPSIKEVTSPLNFRIHHAAPGRWIGALQSWRSRRPYRSTPAFVTGLTLTNPPRHVRTLVGWVVRKGEVAGYLGSWAAGRNGRNNLVNFAQSVLPGDSILFEWWSRPNWELDTAGIGVTLLIAPVGGVHSSLEAREVKSATSVFSVDLPADHRLESAFWEPGAGVILSSIRKNGQVILGSATPPSWPFDSWFSGAAMRGPGRFEMEMITQSDGGGIHGGSPPVTLPAPHTVRFVISRETAHSPLASATR